MDPENIQRINKKVNDLISDIGEEYKKAKADNRSSYTHSFHLGILIDLWQKAMGDDKLYVFMTEMTAYINKEMTKHQQNKLIDELVASGAVTVVKGPDWTN